MIDIDAQPTRVIFEAEALVISDNGRARLAPTSIGRWESMLAKLVGHSLHVTFEKAKVRRSDTANAYLWGVVYVDVFDGLRKLAVEHGEECPFRDREELHEAMKYLVFGREMVSVPGGGWISRAVHSSLLTVQQFNGFVESICHWAAERGIYVRQAISQEALR